MATATRRTLVANPGKRRRKRNGPKKLSAKQIKFFGTARQKAALKANRKRKRKNTASKPRHRKRTVAKSNPVRRRRTTRARKSSHRKRTRRAAVRRNFGEIVSLVNPAKRRSKSMAKARRRKKTTATRRHHRRVQRRNGRRTQRNGMGGSFGADVVEVLYMIGGGVGSKLVTQMALGSSNTGILGYLGNLAAGGILAWGTKSLLKNPKAARDVFKGAILQVVLRAITDYTPFGSYTSQLGMGDYMASNWVQPQRYVDALNSAQVEIPAGWGGGMVVASSGVNANAMGAGNDSGGSGMF